MKSVARERQEVLSSGILLPVRCPKVAEVGERNACHWQSQWTLRIYSFGVWAKYNPFNPNGIVDPNLFSGRAQYAAEILQKLSAVAQGRPCGFFLHGEKGIGKSALAKRIERVIGTGPSPKFIVSYYAITQDQPFHSVIQGCLNCLKDATPATAGSVATKIGVLLKGGEISVPVWGGTASVKLPSGKEGTPSLGSESTLKDEAVSAISKVLTAIKESSLDKSGPDGLVFVLDEMQNIADLTSVATVLRGVLNTLSFRGQGYVSFLLLGIDQSFLDFVSGDTSVSRAIDPIHLDVMPANEAADVLRKAFIEVRLRWDEEALLKRISLAGGFPHSIQILGHHLVDVDGDGYIDAADWDLATSKTTVELRRKDFSRLYSFSGEKVRRDKVLDVLAVSGPLPRKHLVEACEEVYVLKNAYPLIQELEESGAIRRRDDDKLELHSQLFRSAILSVLSHQLDPGSALGRRLFRKESERSESSKNAVEALVQSSPNINWSLIDLSSSPITRK